MDEVRVEIVGPAGPAVLVPTPQAFEPGDSDRVLAATREVLGKGIRKIVVNLADVRFLDSAGIGTLLGCAQTVRDEGGSLGLIGVRPPLRSVLSAAMLLHIVPVFRSVEDAAAGLPPEAPRK